MAVCRMDVLLTVGRIGQGEVNCGESSRVNCGGGVSKQAVQPKAQRVSLVAQTPKARSFGLSGLVSKNAVVKISGGNFGVRCDASPEGGEAPSKSYDVNEVVEEVVESEKNKLPESEKQTPETLTEGEPSPFSPAIDLDTDDTLHAHQGVGVSKETLIEPPRGAVEHSALAGTPNTSGRDWRVYSNGISNVRTAERVSPKVERARGDVQEYQDQKHKQMYGPSESSCDEGSFIALAGGILEQDGGKSIDDYRIRADIFGKSAEIFSALKNRSHSVV